MVHIDENHVARPRSGDLDFKELFQEAITARAGLSMFKSAHKASEWTPSLLAEALAQADPKGGEVDVRTVQNWFQDNDKGISSENIVRLARVFGYGDSEAITAWRTELRAANTRLSSKRRLRRTRSWSSSASKIANDSRNPANSEDRSRKKGVGLAILSERVFQSSDGFGIAIIVWAGYFLLCLMSFVVQNHDVTYSARPGLNKQVGFFWSLSWPVECLFLYPAMFLLIAHSVSFWKRQTEAMEHSDEGEIAWDELICSMRLPFWVAAFVAFVLVFAVQWGGVYLLGLMQKDAPGLVDWILVARLRPDVVSSWEALVVSLLAFFYSGLIYWFYFTGLLLLFAVSHDYSRKATSPKSKLDHSFLEVGGKKLQGVIFRCTVIGILAATVIQLNAIYLKSDGETSLGWLVADSFASLGAHATDWALLDQYSVSSLTSSILLLLHLALFAVCTTKVQSAMRAFYYRDVGPESSVKEASIELGLFFPDPLLRQFFVLGILCLNFSLLGQFVGFTLLLSGSLIVALAGICWPERGSVFHPGLET